MKPIAFSLLIGAACVAFSTAAAADSKTDAKTPSTKFYVTVQGHMTYPEHASVGFQPLFPSPRKQPNAPVATTGTE